MHSWNQKTKRRRWTEAPAAPDTTHQNELAQALSFPERSLFPSGCLCPSAIRAGPVAEGAGLEEDTGPSSVLRQRWTWGETGPEQLDSKGFYDYVSLKLSIHVFHSKKRSYTNPISTNAFSVSSIQILFNIKFSARNIYGFTHTSFKHPLES